MTAPPERTACDVCLRRSRLLGLLNARIEHSARNLDTLIDLLQLEDSVLIGAIGGRRREELTQLHAAPLPASERPAASLCVHARTLDIVANGVSGSVPVAPTATEARTLDIDANGVSGSVPVAPVATETGTLDIVANGVSGRPAAVSVAGDLRSLRCIAAAPIVSIIGTTKPSPYGIEVSSMLARQLSLCGVTIAAAFDEGIAAAAHRGALRAGRPTLAVLAGGVDVCKPAWLGPLWRRLRISSCLITQMPKGLRARRWGVRLREAMLIGLSDLAILVEAQDGASLEAAQLGLTQGRLIAAVPGRVTSALSFGPHRLISKGATLLTEAEDALDLLHIADRRGLRELQASPRTPSLRPSLQRVLERVGAGEDALSTLASGPDAAQTLLALGELEAKGLLRRTDGGRYIPRLR